MNVLSQKVFIYPTETVYGIGTSINNEAGIVRINILKERPKYKSFIILVNSFEMANSLCKNLDENIFNHMNLANDPTTLILDAAESIPHYLKAEDETVALRMVKIPFLNELINKIGSPIISTSANFHGKEPTNKFELLDQELFQFVDFVFDQPRNISVTDKPSKIVKLGTHGESLVIRE